MDGSKWQLTTFELNYFFYQAMKKIIKRKLYNQSFISLLIHS